MSFEEEYLRLLGDVEAERLLREAPAGVPSWRKPSKIELIKNNYNLDKLTRTEPEPRLRRAAADRMAESPVRLPDWKRDIWRESPRKIESFQKPRIPIYEKIYEKKLPKPLPVARADSAFRFTDTGMTDRYELLPDISTTMRGSQLPKVKKVLTELLADPSYVAAEARAVAESYQISANLFYMGASKPKTLRVAVEQRFDDAARKIALGMSQMAHLLGLGQLLNLGNTFTQRDAAVIMRAGIDRVDLCSDQLYQTLTGSKFRDMYVAAVLPKAERLLRHSI